MTNKKELTITEQAVKTIKGIATKCSITENQTGYTFFINPKQRLCKVVITKKALKLELNIELTEGLKTELNETKGIDITDIDKETAKKKKLGTMKHLVIAVDNSFTEKIIKDILNTWNK